MKTSILILVALLLAACTVPPKPVYRLDPTDENALWMSGNRYSQFDLDGVRIAAGFDGTWRNNYLIHLTIANESDQPVLVAPEEFFYRSNLPVAVTTVHALNPESQLLEMDLRHSEEDARYATEVATDATTSILDLMVDVATAADQDHEQYDWEEQAEQREYRESGHERNLRSINDIRGFWQREVIRKTTLLPGYELDGYIVFPVQESADSLDMHYVFADRVAVHHFVQKVHHSD